MSLCPICHLRAVQNIEKSKWLPATKDNLVVGEWYWVKEEGLGLLGAFRFIEIEGDIIRFDGQTNILIKYIKIQPATAPPDLEE